MIELLNQIQALHNLANQCQGKERAECLRMAKELLVTLERLNKRGTGYAKS